MMVADAGGIGSLTIRSLTQQLGVKPMSVYHYVANKDEILDAVVAVANQTGPWTLRHRNAFIGTLRGAGFSVELTAHAFAQFFDADAYPHLLEFTTEHVMQPGNGLGKEFEL